MWRRRQFLASLAIALSGGWMGLSPARAQDITKAASAFVTTLADKVIKVLQDKALDKDARVRALANIFLEGFDVRTIGLFVLGVYGRKANDADRRAYLDVFRDYVVQTYAVRFNSYAGESFLVTKASVDGEAGAWVFSDIGKPGDEPVEVQWRVHQTRNELKIVDVVVEGVSLIVTQRAEFSSILQRNDGNLAALTAMLRKKIVELKKKS